MTIKEWGALGLLILAAVTAAWIFLVPVIPRGPSKEYADTGNRLGLMIRALDRYYDTYGSFPQVGNKEIIALVSGSNVLGLNPESITFMQMTNMPWFDQQGYLIDVWKNPIQFIFPASNKLIVYSFGKDKKNNGGTSGDFRYVLDK